MVREEIGDANAVGNEDVADKEQESNESWGEVIETREGCDNEDQDGADPDAQEEADEPPPSMYFGGCGFGCAFYIGAHKAMVERWGPDFHKRVVIAGGSAGAVMAMQVALGRTNEQMHAMYKWTASEAMKRGPVASASTCLMEAVENIIKDVPFEVCEYLSKGNCYISVTEFPFNHQFLSKWASDDELMHCIAASCHIPLYSHRGKESFSSFVDGAYGFTGEALKELHENDTLFIGIDPTADVGRSLTNSQMLYPLLGDEYDEVVESGYRAMMQWHHSKKADKVNNRKPNYPFLVMIWLFRVVHIITDALGMLLGLLLWPFLFVLQLLSTDKKKSE